MTLTILLLQLVTFIVPKQAGNIYIKSSPKICRELCSGSDKPFSFLEEYYCRRITESGKKITHPVVAPSFMCLDKHATKDTPESITIAESEQRLARPKALQIPAGSHGCACGRQSECRFTGAICHDKLCHCKVGYYFNPKNNACVTRCDFYDDEMTVYRRKGIAKHNRRVFEHLSADECKRHCQQEKSFVCLTAEYGRKYDTTPVCFLSESGFLDVSNVERQNFNLLFSLIQRTRCQ